ncbi:MAG TPA: hypothetical protein VFE24_08415 [Pirellulales bacterium]|jgi:hypothetical protein|nr:hypothetical protein [Pirellulales bacterium]
MNRAFHIATCKAAVLSCALVGLLAESAWSQRVQFPTPVAPTDPFAQPAAAAAPVYPAPQPSFAPNVSPYPAQPYPTQPYPAQPYPAQPYPVQPPPYQPPPGGFDPYSMGPSGSYAPPTATPYSATPYSATPNAIFPSNGGPGQPSWDPGEWLTPAGDGTRFLRELRFEDTWLAPIGGGNKLGVDDVDLSATFQFPIFAQRQAPLFVTPGFAFHFWNGPVSTPTQIADLPPETYDAYLDTSWSPVITPWLTAELDVRVGVYSDFHLVSTESIRILGGGDALITLSPIWKVKLGLEYLDRLKVKLLPIVGVVWTPNDESRWEIVFPRPKIAQRLNPLGTISLWWYIAGEYGGGNWTIRRASGLGDDFDYNDIRLELGIEWATPQNWKGMLEIGYAFNRELIYQSGAPQSFDPSGTLLFQAGLAY